MGAVFEGVEGDLSHEESLLGYDRDYDDEHDDNLGREGMQEWSQCVLAGTAGQLFAARSLPMCRASKLEVAMIVIRPVFQGTWAVMKHSRKR
jgi:hypothetical protein